VKFETLEQMYKYLGISRKSHVWSWGVSTDKFVLLQVWSDEVVSRDERYFASVWRERGDEYTSLGMPERQDHLDEIRQGKACFFILCEPQKKEVAPRIIKSFKGSSVLRGAGLPVRTDDGSWYVEYVERIDIADFKKLINSS
jgi:hypothetical protein